MGWVRKAIKSARRSIKRFAKSNLGPLALAAIPGIGWGLAAAEYARRGAKDLMTPEVPEVNFDQNPLPAPTAPEDSLDLSLNPNARRQKVGRNSLKISKTSSTPRSTIGVNLPR